jgi:hypothetical protein
MQKLNDLSRSLTPLDPGGTLFRGSTRPDLVLARLGPTVAGSACLLCPGISDINLLGCGESIILCVPKTLSELMT